MRISPRTHRGTLAGAHAAYSTKLDATEAKLEQDGRKARKKAKKKVTKTAAHVLKCLDEQIAACRR